MKRNITLGFLILFAGALIAGCGSKKGGEAADTTGKSMLPSKTAPSDCSSSGDGYCTDYKTGKFKISNATEFTEDYLGTTSGSSNYDSSYGETVPIEPIWERGKGMNFGGFFGSLVQSGLNCGIPILIGWGVSKIDEDHEVNAGCNTGSLYGDDGNGFDDYNDFDSDFAAVKNGQTISAEVQYVYKTSTKRLVGAIVSINGETKQYKQMGSSTTMFVDKNEDTALEIYDNKYVRIVSDEREILGRFY